MALPTRSLPSLGFVIALRGTIIGRSGAARREWLIASRWGDAGSYLAIARTLVPVGAATIAPPHLVPRWSALALLDASSAHSSSHSFAFADQCPAGLTLAGRFAPSLGSVRVDGDGNSIRLRGDARCLLRKSRQDWQFEGVRGAWVGEFIEIRS
jgi:hypothetical protein